MQIAEFGLYAAVMKVLLVLIAGSGALLRAQEPPTVVRAAGDATIMMASAQTRLRLVVITKSGTAERAREKNAERGTDVIGRLRGLLGQDAEIETANYSLNKTYTGEYAATNMIQVRVADAKAAGEVIDVAAKSGATVLAGMESSAQDEQDAKSEALKQATAQAQRNAAAVASALGMQVVRIVSAEASDLPLIAPPARNEPRFVSAKKRTVPTPVANPKVEVRANVVVTAEVMR